MNETILNLWMEQGDVSLNSDLFPIVLKFVKYMDKHSLWLTKYENDHFLFSNDAQRLSFSVLDIKSHIHNLEQGIAFPWHSFQ